MVSELNSWQLVKAIQEQQKMIEELKDVNKFLINENEKLKSDINELKKIVCLDSNATICLS